MLAMYKQEAISFDISRSIIFFRQSVNRQKRQFQLGQKKLKIDSRGRWRGEMWGGENYKLENRSTPRNYSHFTNCEAAKSNQTNVQQNGIRFEPISTLF